MWVVAAFPSPSGPRSVRRRCCRDEAEPLLRPNPLVLHLLTRPRGEGVEDQLVVSVLRIADSCLVHQFLVVVVFRVDRPPPLKLWFVVSVEVVFVLGLAVFVASDFDVFVDVLVVAVAPVVGIASSEFSQGSRFQFGERGVGFGSVEVRVLVVVKFAGSSELGILCSKCI